MTALLLVTGGAFGQNPAQVVRTSLFQLDKACACVKTKGETATAKGVDTRIGKSLYQVFWSRTRPPKELFRVQIADAADTFLRAWNFGIADEADFNGDGIPDYAWYGGDDTSEEMYLFLSSTSGYRRVDIRSTIWEAFGNGVLRGPMGDFLPMDIVLERSTKGLALIVDVEHGRAGEAEKTDRRVIPQAEWK